MNKQTSWDPLAEWYDGWMGQAGSKHHQIVIPILLDLLDLQPKQRLIDFGCGQGVLSSYVHKKQVEYVGIDLSSKLIEIANKRHANHGQFYQGDVTGLSESGLPLQQSSFDKATFLLSIADIDNLAGALASASWALKNQGQLVIAMIHPAFRIPRQSGWGYDQQRKLQYRRIDSYLTPNAIPLKPYPGQKGVSKSHHRPIQDYMRALRQNNFVVTDLREVAAGDVLPPDTPRHKKRAAAEIPLFLVWQAELVE